MKLSIAQTMEQVINKYVKSIDPPGTPRSSI